MARETLGQRNDGARETPTDRHKGLAGTPFYPLVVVGLAMMTQGGFTLLGQGFAPLLPYLQEEFSLTSTHVGLFTGMIFLTACAASTIFGWAMDRLGERAIIGLFMLLGGAAVLLIPLAPTFIALLGIAALMGTFRSPGNAAGGRAVIGWVSKKRRATAMGFKQAGSSIYSALAALAVPVIAVAYGWQAAVIALGLFLALSAVAIFALYREPPTSKQKKDVGSLKEGLAEILRNRDAGYVMAVSFLLLGAEVTVATYFILFLHDSHGFSLVAAGGLLAVIQLTSVGMRIAWGSLSDVLWHGRRKPVLYLGCAASAAVLIALAVLPNGIPEWVLLLAAVGLGATARALTPIGQTLMAEVTNPNRLGLVLGFSGTVGRSSTFILPPLFGIVADAVDFRASWLGLGLMMATALFFLSRVREGDRDEAERGQSAP